MRAPEKMPEFQGGMPGLFAYLSGEIRYPETALEEAIEGRVVVSFVVEPDGAISDVRVVRGVHPDLDEEAVRAVNAMPKWIPGEQDGKPVRVRYTLPVSFKLGD